MKTLAHVAAVMIIFFALLCVSVGGWYLARRINYKFSYRSLVQETVREMVKAEALKP